MTSYLLLSGEVNDAIANNITIIVVCREEILSGCEVARQPVLIDTLEHTFDRLFSLSLAVTFCNR